MKTNPYVGSPIPVLAIKVRQGLSVILLFLKINLSTTISMERSRRELSIDMVIHRGIFKNNQITLFPSFTLCDLNARNQLNAFQGFAIDPTCINLGRHERT